MDHDGLEPCSEIAPGCRLVLDLVALGMEGRDFPCQA
jgi:hypothetical protein